MTQREPAGAVLLRRVEDIQDMLIDHATGGRADQPQYTALRRALLDAPRVVPLVPEFVRRSRKLDQFWSFIKNKFPSYQERRTFIYDSFAELAAYAENQISNPVADAAEDRLHQLNSAEVLRVWTIALNRRTADPEGAITSARTLLETVCKHILDDLDGQHPDVDLPKLYRLTSERLTLAPSQHTEDAFKRILGGVSSVVEGLGTLRNRLSDAHGKGPLPAKPAPRHAEVSVNLSGAVASFLVATWEARQSQP